jgi:hypothetical protein
MKVNCPFAVGVAIKATMVNNSNTAKKRPSGTPPLTQIRQPGKRLRENITSTKADWFLKTAAAIQREQRLLDRDSAFVGFARKEKKEKICFASLFPAFSAQWPGRPIDHFP